MLISGVRLPGPVQSQYPVHQAGRYRQIQPVHSRGGPEPRHRPSASTARDAPKASCKASVRLLLPESTVTQMAGTGSRGGDEMKAVAGRSGGGTERGRCCPLTLQLLQLLDDPRPDRRGGIAPQPSCPAEATKLCFASMCRASTFFLPPRRGWPRAQTSVRSLRNQDYYARP